MNFLAKIRAKPRKIRLIIFYMIVAVVAAPLFLFWFQDLKNRISRINLTKTLQLEEIKERIGSELSPLKEKLEPIEEEASKKKEELQKLEEILKKLEENPEILKELEAETPQNNQ